MVGVAAAAVVIGQASAALATPATAPTTSVVVNETQAPVLRGVSTDTGDGTAHAMHFYARTIGSTSWDLLNDVVVPGTNAYAQLPDGSLSIGRAFEYQIADCDFSGCATSAIARGHSSPDLAAGNRPGATRLPFTIGDNLTAQVDVGSGNLLLTTTQLTLKRIAGSLPLGVTFNSLTLAPGSRFTGSISPGWRFSAGADIYLKSYSNGWVSFYGPNGLTGDYQPGSTTGQYVSPKTIKSTLVQNPDGTWDLTLHSSGDRYHFNAAGQLTELHGKSTGNSKFTTFSYNSAGALTQVQTDKGTTGARTVTVTPAAGGTQIQQLVQSPDSSHSRTATYTYNSSGQLSEITDTLGRHTDFGYGSAGDVTSVIAPGGAETDFAYNTAHRVTSVTQPAAGGKSAVTRFTYNTDIGQTMVANPNTDQSQAVSAVPHTTYNLDGTGMLLVAQAIDPAGNTRSATYTPFDDVQTAQDAAGTSTFDYTANGGESLDKATSPTTAAGSYAYGNSGAAQYEPSGSTDTQGNSSIYSYDGAGNLTQSSDQSQTTTAKVSYNDDGTVKDATDPAGSTTTYQYATENYGISTAQIASITPPAGNSLGVRSYTYDAFGRIATYRSGRLDTANPPQPIVQTFSYDAADRVTKVAYSDGTPAVTYTYNPAGQVATRSDASGTTTYTYDPLGRLASRTHTAGGGTLTYAYDLDGNLVSETDGNGTTTDTYDSRNMLTSTATPDGKVIAFGYDADGKRTDTWFATNSDNSTWAAHSHTDYDASHRVSRVWTATASNDNSRVSDLSYSYTAPTTSACSTVQTSMSGKDSGLRWSQTDNLTGRVTSYCYDSQNRLTAATTPGGDSWSYSYDGNGNRTQVMKNGAVVQSLTHNSGNQISSAGYSYDAAGNLTATPGSVSLGYNGSDQLVSRSGGLSGSYTYAGSDQTELIGQTVPGGGTYSYTYGRTDQNGLPILDTFTNSNGTSYLTHDDTGTPLAFKTYQGKVNYYALDGLGSPVALINTSGTVTATYSYDPWGSVTVSNPTGGTAAGLNPIGFAGGLEDPNTGYLKYGMRYYDPGTGRFTQQDSVEVIGDPSRGNRYEYAGANPANYTDPTGQSLLGDVIGLGIAVVGLGIAVAGAFVASPVLIGVGIAVAAVGVAAAADVVGCDVGTGVLCSVF